MKEKIQPESDKARPEPQSGEADTRCYRHVNQLGITPAPWDICKKPENHQWYKDTTIYSQPHQKRVADTCMLSSSQKADNNLIVSAPDLYEALKTIYVKHKDDFAHYDVLIIEDALKRARGIID